MHKKKIIKKNIYKQIFNKKNIKIKYFKKMFKKKYLIIIYLLKLISSETCVNPVLNCVDCDSLNNCISCI